MQCLLLLLCAYASLSDAQQYLLPADVAPSSYDLRFIYDIDPATNFSFYGLANIIISASKETNKIVLHAEGYTISEDRVSIDGPTDLRVTSVNLNSTYDFLTITLDNKLRIKENYTLTIPFYGNLKPELNGPYISTYEDVTTKNKEYLIATQFEAINARKGFPCFDEPMYKATFRITIGHSKEFNTVSNMPQFNTTDVNLLQEYWPWETVTKTFKKDQSQFIWDTFQESVKMSTYLVAYIVSKFGYTESPPGLTDTTFKIWARKDALSQTAYAAYLGPRILQHYIQFFDVPFPLPKQDMIAVPDFSAGAMENWGLITYRETDLLFDEQQSSLLNKERMAEVISHELAHQWFGNLVTMKWWTDLWLNEGFASYIGTRGVTAIEPELRLEERDAVEAILSVLSIDALETSHPVATAVIEDPRLIDELFDEISYRKGAIVIRMLVNILGEDVFRKGIHNYLVKHSYKNAEKDDLWYEMTSISQQYGGLTRNVSIKEVMDTWTTQTGYPVLTVNRDYSEKTLTVQQKRFLNLGTKASTAVSWWIPLRVMCEVEAGQKLEPVQWLGNNEGVKTKHQFEHASGPNEWVLFNPDMLALYRVNYDSRNWQLLISALTSPKLTTLPVLGRVQLLSDAFALAWNSQMDYSTALQLANYLRNEKEYLPLSAGFQALRRIEVLLKRSADYGAYQKFVRKLITQQYHEIGGFTKKASASKDDAYTVRLQTLLTGWACRMQVPGCEENAMELFQQWMDDSDPDEHNPIPQDLRATVYAVAVSRGSVAHWRFVLERKQRANVATAKEALTMALTSSKDVWILKQLLEWTISDSGEIRKQDAARVLNAVVSSDVGYYIAKEFIYTRIEEIYGAFGQGRRLGRVLKTMLTQFTTDRELDEFLKWREANGKYLEESQLGVSQAIEAAKVNIQWVKNNKKHVVQQLREFATHSDLPMAFRMIGSTGDKHKSLSTVILCTIFILIRSI